MDEKAEREKKQEQWLLANSPVEKFPSLRMRLNVWTRPEDNLVSADEDLVRVSR